MRHLLGLPWQFRLRASTAGSTGLIPGQGTKIPHAAEQGQETFFNSKTTDLLTLLKPDLGHSGASLVAQMIKNLPAMLETKVQSLGREDPLEKGMATHSGILAWRIPWTEEPNWLQSTGSQRMGHN